MPQDWQIRSEAKKYLIRQGNPNPTRLEIYTQAYGLERAQRLIAAQTVLGGQGVRRGAETIATPYWRKVMAENRAKRLAQRLARIDRRRKSIDT